MIGPDTTLTDVTRRARAPASSAPTATDSTIGADATVGPFAYLRPGTVLGAPGKLGAFVETKNADIGEHSKVPHLTYVGDATIGEHSNIGASSVFVNYDGVNKSRTVVGSHVRTGSDTMFVAPVHVGDGAYTGAGTVLRFDVPPGALAVSGGKQRNIEGWVQTKSSRYARGRVRQPPTGLQPTVQICSDQPMTASTKGWHEPVTANWIDNQKNLMLFSGRAHPELAEQVAKELDIRVTPQTARDFANGEIFVRFEESVRGSDAFVLQSHPAPLNTWVMEQLIMIDALKRGSAKRITAVLPFYPYARQDKKHRGREPISARLIADLLKTAGADRIITVDLHTDQIQGFFDGPVDHMHAQGQLAEYIARQLRHREHHRRLPRLRPRPRRREVGRLARRRAAGVHPQDARSAGAQPGQVQPRRR